MKEVDGCRGGGKGREVQGGVDIRQGTVSEAIEQGASNRCILGPLKLERDTL